jgi:hypothetical protein
MGLKYTATELKKKDRKELEKLIDEEGLELDEDANIGDLRAALLEVEEPEDDEVEDDELDDEADDEEDDLPEADEVDDIEEDEPKPAAKKTPKKTKYTDGGKDGNGNKLLGAKEVATFIGTDAKTLRQFFRSGKGSFEAVGAGGRYEFNEADLPKIKAEFEGWQANKPGRGRASGGSTSTKKRRGKTQPTADETIDEIEEVEDLDDLDDIELD